MQRVASVKRVMLESKDDVRGPEHVDRVWDDAVDGAWAPGKAPIGLLTKFLRLVQDEDVEAARDTAEEILSIEPKNELVRDLLSALKQQHTLNELLESEEEESTEEGEDDSEEEDGEHDEDDDEGEDTPQQDHEYKDRDEK